MPELICHNSGRSKSWCALAHARARSLACACHLVPGPRIPGCTRARGAHAVGNARTREQKKGKKEPAARLAIRTLLSAACRLSWFISHHDENHLFFLMWQSSSRILRSPWRRIAHTGAGSVPTPDRHCRRPRIGVADGMPSARGIGVPVLPMTASAESSTRTACGAHPHTCPYGDAHHARTK